MIFVFVSCWFVVLVLGPVLWFLVRLIGLVMIQVIV